MSGNSHPKNRALSGGKHRKTSQQLRLGKTRLAKEMGGPRQRNPKGREKRKRLEATKTVEWGEWPTQGVIRMNGLY